MTSRSQTQRPQNRENINLSEPVRAQGGGRHFVCWFVKPAVPYPVHGRVLVEIQRSGSLHRKAVVQLNTDRNQHNQSEEQLNRTTTFAPSHYEAEWTDRLDQTSGRTEQDGPAQGRLTEMTDTPAVLSPTFGLVLKCFFIFPATDSWWSFSHSPSSWTEQQKKRNKSAFVGKWIKKSQVTN